MPATLNESQKICFTRGLAAGAVGAKGFSDVTLITGETEALGHGIYVDEASIEGLMGLLMGKSLPGYLTHEGAIFSDRLGKEIGFFSGFYRDGMKLKARNFSFLNAFMKHDAEDYEKLVELAEKMPDQFGLSVVFSGRAVWVMQDGSEVDADEPMPEGAMRGIPSVRFSTIESADFVKAPAANPGGLFARQVDAGGKGMSKAIAINFSGTTFPTIEQWGESVTTTDTGAYWVYPDDQSAALAAKQSEFDAALAKLNEQLAAKDAEIKSAKDALAARESEVAKAIAERDEALKFDIRKTGVRAADLPDTSINAASEPALPEPAKTDRELWAQYHELAAKDAKLAAAFKAKHMTADRYSARR